MTGYELLAQLSEQPDLSLPVLLAPAGYLIPAEAERLVYLPVDGIVARGPAIVIAAAGRRLVGESTDLVDQRAELHGSTD